MRFKWSWVCVAALLPLCIFASGAGTPKWWYSGLIFNNASLSFEFIRALGYTYEGGADIGESFDTANHIVPQDTDHWYAAWLQTADRLNKQAKKSYNAHDNVSARTAWLRASNYYRTASFYMDAVKNRPKAISSWKLSQQTFLRAIQSLPYIKSVNIPYEKTHLHGYLMTSKFKNAPLLIINNGVDGTAEELYFMLGKAAYQRGYNVLFFDGPGQGQTIKEQNIPFRPDWEKVIGPAIDFALRQPNIQTKQIALAGFSLGGYLAARACAFEPRIKACILDPSVDNIRASILQHFPANIVQLLPEKPKAFNKIINEIMKSDIEVNSYFTNGMWVFGATTPAAFIKKTGQYRLGNDIKKIKAPTLVIKNQADIFNTGQAAMYKALTGPKTFHYFKRQSTAEAHCQAGAMGISNEVLLNWLNKTLNYHKDTADSV